MRPDPPVAYFYDCGALRGVTIEPEQRQARREVMLRLRALRPVQELVAHLRTPAGLVPVALRADGPERLVVEPAPPVGIRARVTLLVAGDDGGDHALLAEAVWRRDTPGGSVLGIAPLRLARLVA